MPSRTPGKYSLDSATLMMPSSTHTITATKLRGTHSDVGSVSSSHNSSFQMFSGSGSVYNTPRSSMCNNIPGQEAQKSGPTFLTGNAVNLSPITEAMDWEPTPGVETTPEHSTRARRRSKRQSLVDAIEAAVVTAEKKVAAVSSTNGPVRWFIRGVKMLCQLLLILLRLVGSMVTGFLIAVTILFVVFFLQPDNFLVLSVSKEVKRLLEAYDISAAGFV